MSNKHAFKQYCLLYMLIWQLCFKGSSVSCTHYILQVCQGSWMSSLHIYEGIMHAIWKGHGSWNEFWAYLFNISWSQRNHFQDYFLKLFSINSHVARQHQLGILCKGRSHNCALQITLHQIGVCILLQWSLASSENIIMAIMDKFP